jgi:uncharacterized protein
MTVLIIHGIGGHAGIHWQQWLNDELSLLGHSVLMPDMPEADHPNRSQWLNIVEKLVKENDSSQLVIVGHSLGVATALDLIEIIEEPVKGLVCVSGFAKDYGAELNGYFMKEKSIDFSRVADLVRNRLVVYGDDDPYVTQDALAEVANKLGVEPVVISGGGHLNSETGYTEFPLLLELMQSMIFSEK